MTIKTLHYLFFGHCVNSLVFVLGLGIYFFFREPQKNTSVQNNHLRIHTMTSKKDGALSFSGAYYGMTKPWTGLPQNVELKLTGKELLLDDFLLIFSYIFFFHYYYFHISSYNDFEKLCIC